MRRAASSEYEIVAAQQIGSRCSIRDSDSTRARRPIRCSSHRGVIERSASCRVPAASTRRNLLLVSDGARCAGSRSRRSIRPIGAVANSAHSSACRARTPRRSSFSSASASGATLFGKRIRAAPGIARPLVQETAPGFLGDGRSGPSLNAVANAAFLKNARKFVSRVPRSFDVGTL
jgi:hypothetical protein